MESIYKYYYAVSCKAVTYKNADNSNCLRNINIGCSALLCSSLLCSALLSKAYPVSSNCQVTLMFSPNQFINYTRITLDDFDDLIRHILIHIVRHWNTQVIILVHLHSHVNRLQQMVTINTCKDKVALIQCFGSLGRGADAHRREGMSYASEKAAFLR